VEKKGAYNKYPEKKLKRHPIQSEWKRNINGTLLA
jgi:hypothetical protein